LKRRSHEAPIYLTLNIAATRINVCSPHKAVLISGLLERVAIRNEQQSVIAQALVNFGFLVLEATHRFKPIWFREHRTSLPNSGFEYPVIIPLADGSPPYLGVPSI
jgi:hypothetical protein